MKLSECKIGDKVKIPLLGCGCCLSFSPTTDWATDGETRTATVVLLDVSSNGKRLLGSETNDQQVFSTIEIDIAHLPYRYGDWKDLDYQCVMVEAAKPEEKKPITKAITEYNVGDQVKITVAELKRSGYTTANPLIGTIIKDIFDTRGYPCIAWKAGSEVSVDYVKRVSDLNFADLSEGIFVLADVQAELIAPYEQKQEATHPPGAVQERQEPEVAIESPKVVVMKKLSELTPGTRVRISIAEASRSGAKVELPLEGIIIKNTERGETNFHPCVAWKEEEQALKKIDVNEVVSDVNFPTLTKGCHFYQNTEVEVLAEAPIPAVEEKQPQPTKRLLKDCKPGDKVRIIPADAGSVFGNGGIWNSSKDPLVATVITYKGKATFIGFNPLAWDPELNPNEKRWSNEFNEAAFPKLTRGLFILPETPCELIAASETTSTPEAPQTQPVATVEKKSLDSLMGELGRFDQVMKEILAETKQQVESLEKTFPFYHPSAEEVDEATNGLNEEDEKLARKMVDVFGKIEERFDRIEEQEKEGELDSKSALEQMFQILQAIEDSFDKTEPDRVARGVSDLQFHSATHDTKFLNLPKAKDKQQSSKAGFLLACAAAGVGLSGLAASALPTAVKTPKKSRKKTAKKDKSTNAS